MAKVSNMVVTVEGTELVVRIPMEADPKPSSSGKTLVVASATSHTEIIVKGKTLTVGLNAYIKV